MNKYVPHQGKKEMARRVRQKEYLLSKKGEFVHYTINSVSPGDFVYAYDADIVSVV